MKKFKKIMFAVLVLTIIVLPILSFAQAPAPIPPKTIQGECGTSVDNIGDIICRIGFLLNTIVPILLLLGILYFVWGVITYMIGADEEQKKKGKNKIIYGIIGIVVIVSLWGLVSIVVKTFGLDQQDLTMINPANVIDNNLQVEKTNSCFTTYQGSGDPKLGDLLNYATCLIGTSVIPLLFILATASFIWGVIQYVINSDEEAKRAKGRSFMIWGIIALTVMVSIWGLVRIFGNTFDIDYTVPQVNTN